MRRFWVVVLVVVALSCDGGTPADVAVEPTDRATRSIDATNAGTEAPPLPRASPSVVPGVVPGVSPSVVPSVVPGVVPGVSPSVVPSVVPEGFGIISGRVVASDGEVCEICLWLADDAEARARGLMHVTDLDELDGMAFRYDAPHTTSFTMRNTVMPLSIAFFGADGVHLGEFDMEPCVAEPCASYPTPSDFVVAIEVPQGGLPDLGIGAGSRLELLAEGCSSAAPATT